MKAYLSFSVLSQQKPLFTTCLMLLVVVINVQLLLCYVSSLLN